MCVCAGNTFGLEVFQWLAGSLQRMWAGLWSRAGLFIHKPGGTCKKETEKARQPPPDTFNDHAVQLLHPRELQDALRRSVRELKENNEESNLLFACLQLKQQQQQQQQTSRQEQSECWKVTFPKAPACAVFAHINHP